MYLQTFFPLIFTTCTYQIVNMQFGMYFYIPTVFLIIKNTYHFVNYQFGMYLQTFFPLIFTTYTYQIVNMQFGMYFTELHLTFPRLPRRPYGLLAMTIFQKSSLFIQKFTSLTTSFSSHNPPSPNS